MGFKVFLDANVLLDFLLKRDHFEDSRDIMSLVIEGKINAYITPAIVHITGYWLLKAYGSEKAKQLLLSLLDNVRAIDISHELTLWALNSKIDGDVYVSIFYFS